MAAQNDSSKPIIDGLSSSFLDALLANGYELVHIEKKSHVVSGQMDIHKVRLSHLYSKLFLKGRHKLKAMAQLLQTSESYLYRMQEDEKSRCKAPVELILEAMLAQQDFDILKYMAQKCGLFLVDASFFTTKSMPFRSFCKKLGIKASIEFEKE
jgi:hypothetical protein